MAGFPVSGSQATFLGNVVKDLAIAARSFRVQYRERIIDIFCIHAEITEYSRRQFERPRVTIDSFFGIFKRAEMIVQLLEELKVLKDSYHIRSDVIDEGIK